MNKIMVVGRLTKDADLRYTPNSKAISNFTVACDSGYGDKKKTQFFRCLLWGDRAEKTTPYLLKGTSVTVFGEFSLNEYQKKDGGNGYSLDVNVNDFSFQGGKQSTQDQPVPTPPKTRGYESKDNPPIDEFEDDIPF